MDPGNAALITVFARYSSGIKGAEQLLPKEMQDAPELNIPPELVSKGVFLELPPADVMRLYTRIWTEIRK
jgi:spermidine/putrescine transport system substrate-binding protein